MNVITKEILKAIMPNIEKNILANPNFKGYTLDRIVGYLNKYAEEFGITTPLRQAHYLAQIAHECGEFRYTEENLNYSAEGLLKIFGKYFNKANVNAYARNPKRIASKVYANRMGNGNELSGDGWKYRGRGVIQLTGKENYAEYKKYCGFDVVADPDLICKPVGAIRSSMWFWRLNGLNILADKGEFVLITKRINNGTNGLKERKEYLQKALKEFKR